MGSDNIIRKPNLQTAHTFTADEVEFVKSLAPRIRDLVASGADPGDALVSALREARDTFTRLQADAYFPASTSSQTIGAFGTSTASAIVFPLPVFQDVAFNHIKILQSLSMVSSTVSGQQTISSRFGLFSNNAGTLSQISSGSFSLAVTVSSVSGTVSFPTGTDTSGYAYGTSSWSATAQAQSLFGTAGNRVIGMQFGGSMSFAPGLYYVGVHQRQSTSSAAVGLSSAFVGNAMNGTTNVGPIGMSAAAHSSRSDYHLGAHGFYTSTGSAGYSGTALPSSMLLSGFNNNMNVMPMVTLMST
jgi:hypothetical protein